MGRHGAAYHWDDMGQHCIVAACGDIALWQHGAALDWGGIPLGRDGVAYHWDGMGRHGIGTAWGGMELRRHGTLAADLDGIPLWQHGADLDEMPLWQHGVDLDGMPLRRTWMGCPSGGLGWDALEIQQCHIWQLHWQQNT